MRTLLSTVAGVSMIFWACPALAQSGTGLDFFVLRMEIRAIDGAQGAGAAESFAVEQIRRDGPARRSRGGTVRHRRSVSSQDPAGAHARTSVWNGHADSEWLRTAFHPG